MEVTTVGVVFVVADIATGEGRIAATPDDDRDFVRNREEVAELGERIVCDAEDR